ncbi:hypothetical protein EVAR_23505_1 [Eumeta japonica]|uniref:Uncharacterized protein n=1 Tax=Eumeta variegata TaxID=151549 RepID=A0A4C1W3A4_EUMVA|nr:hypothetical protein EVAR_23505_1 [Eumeta japonica]
MRPIKLWTEIKKRVGTPERARKLAAHKSYISLDIKSTPVSTTVRGGRWTRNNLRELLITRFHDGANHSAGRRHADRDKAPQAQNNERNAENRQSKASVNCTEP